MSRKHSPKINRGQLKAARANKNLVRKFDPMDNVVPVTIGTPVRIRSLSLSRLERTVWAGKHGVIARIEREHGMTMAFVRLRDSYKTVKVPLAEVTSTEIGREFAPKNDDNGEEWNPMRSPFAAPDARVQ
jgi:hypothetical protein